MGVLADDLAEIEKFLLGFLSDLFVGGLNGKVKLFVLTSSLPGFVICKQVDGLISFPLSPDEVAGIDLVDIFE